VRFEASDGDAVQVRFPLERSSSAPSVARCAVRQWLAEVDGRHEVDDVVLVVSELVTNAVVHAETPSLLVLEMTPGKLRVEVHDESVDAPVPRDPDPQHGGYGLQLVESIADEWGWSTTPTGKVVWAEHRWNSAT
jgi:anti-sigma regulatory factor (Ser/Thr protein kinase)